MPSSTEVPRWLGDRSWSSFSVGTYLPPTIQPCRHHLCLAVVCFGLSVFIFRIHIQLSDRHRTDSQFEQETDHVMWTKLIIPSHGKQTKKRKKNRHPYNRAIVGTYINRAEPVQPNKPIWPVCVDDHIIFWQPPRHLPQFTPAVFRPLQFLTIPTIHRFFAIWTATGRGGLLWLNLQALLTL